MRPARRTALIGVLLLPAIAGAFVVQDRASREGGRLFVQVLDLDPGTYTLQLILGDQNHIPHDPPVVSERITIVVK
jgi:hypothetical protein